MVVNGRHCERRRDRSVRRAHLAVAQYENSVAGRDRSGRCAAQRVDRRFERIDAIRNREERRQRNRPQSRIGDTAQRGHRLLRKHRLGDANLLRVLGGLLEQIALRPEVHRQRHHELLANRIDRGIGNLREHLPEVRGEELRTLRQNRERRVVPHGPSRLFTSFTHWSQYHFQFVGRIPKRPLPSVKRNRPVSWQLILLFRDERSQINPLLGNPPPVRPHHRQLHLDRFVVEYPPLRGVDDEHLARLESPLGANVPDGNRQRARFRRHHDEIVGRNYVPRGAESVAIEHRRDLASVGEGDCGRPVPRLHQRSVVLVKCPPLLRHVVVAFPRLGNQHRHRVREGPSRERQQLEHVVERS